MSLSHPFSASKESGIDIILVLTLDASQRNFGNLLPKYTRSGVTFIYFGIRLSKMTCSRSKDRYSIFRKPAEVI